MGFQDLIDTYIFPPTPEDDAVPSFDGSDSVVSPKKGKARKLSPDEEEITAPPLMDKKTAKELQPLHSTLAKLANTFGEDEDKGGHMIMPGTQEFHEALGTSAKANGINPAMYNMPVIGPLLSSFSPDIQSLRSKQAAADTMYTALLQAKLGHVADRFGAPKSLNEAQTMFPGVLKPTPEQTIMAPTGPGAAMAPTADPSAPLTDAQVALTQGLIKGVGAGHLMSTPEGIVPTSFAAAEGRKVDPALQNQYWSTLEAAGIIPPGTASKIEPTVQGAVPPAVLTSLGSNVTQSATSSKSNQLSQSVRDVLAAKGLAHTPENIALARETLKQEADAVEKQKALYKAGNDQQLMLAQRLFNKMPHELNKHEYDIVKEEELKRAAQLASYEKAATITTLNETQPLNEHAPFWLNAKGIAASPNMTRAEAAKEGYKAVPPAALEGVNSAKAAKVMLGQYEDVIKRVLVKATGSTTLDFAKVNLNRAKAWIKANAGDTDVQALDALNSNIALYSRALGDTGNIAVAEQLMRLAGLPNWTSTQESSLAKLKSLEMSLDAVIKGRGIPIDTSLNTYNKPNEKTEKPAKKSAKARYEELHASGMKDDAIYDKLAQEGYRVGD